MKTYATILFVLGLVAVAGLVLADAADRFKGASHDGYDVAGFYQTKPYDPNLVNARFGGASYDGYDKVILTGTLVIIPSGTVIMIR